MKAYMYYINEEKNARAYDETLAVACIEGLMNREKPQLYLMSEERQAPGFWLKHFSAPDGWLHDCEFERITGFDALLTLALPYVKGAIIWDESVNATVNVATTIAGLEDGIVMSPEFYEEKGAGLPIICDLRGQFDGSISGSAKNDAYRWAIKELLPKCCGNLMCLFSDAWMLREKGATSYIVTRDRAVKDRAFVYDLSPWGDEVPKDDLDAPMGCDKETYLMLLEGILENAGGKRMTEVCGFFNFPKYSKVEGIGATNKHHPVSTEWETVYLISAYNCYQNTVADNCFNISFHQHYGLHPLKQVKHEKPELKEKLYVCAFQGDFDSATPLYDFMCSRELWTDEGRGSFPITWGVNPNLMESYPDIFDYLYKTAAPSDCFTGDASMAGYFNPSRVRPHLWDTVVKHNKYFYDMADMTLSPMVLDCEESPRSALKEVAKFSPDGMGTIIIDFHTKYNADSVQEPVPAAPYIVDGMPVIKMINDVCNTMDAREHADALKRECAPGKTQFALVRNIWRRPSEYKEMYDAVREMMPEYDIEYVNASQFFALLKEYLEK